MKKNLLREGIAGKRLSSHPMFMFIHERQVDWAVIIACAFLPIPYVASKLPLFLASKAICAFLIWFLCHKYFINYSKYLAETKIFDEVEKLIGKQLSKPDFSPAQITEVINLEPNCFASIERLVKKSPLLISMLSPEDKTSNIEEMLQNIFTKLPPEERKLIEQDAAVVNKGAKIMGSHLNLLQLGFYLNRIRRVDSKFPGNVKNMYAMLGIVFLFFLIYTLENSMTWN